MSSLPKVDTAYVTAAATSLSLRTSQCTYLALASPSSVTRRSPASSSMSTITTLAPFRTNRRAVASPSPAAPPVITATLSTSLVAVQQPSDHHKQHTSSWYYNLFHKTFNKSEAYESLKQNPKAHKLISIHERLNLIDHRACSLSIRKKKKHSLNVNPRQKLIVTTTCKKSSTFLRSHSSQLV